MAAAVIGLVLLIVLIIVAARMIGMKNIPNDVNQESSREPAIHASGIYSIIRNSPREDLLRIRPQEAEIQKYLASLNEDIHGRPLSDTDRLRLADRWRHSMEENIQTIERGDADNVEFYYFDDESDRACPVCAQYLRRGQFVSREELFKYPPVIPPFHLGCSTRISPYRSRENLRETASRGMSPFFSGSTPPPLPHWKQTVTH